jgi:hypothetical protein
LTEAIYDWDVEVDRLPETRNALQRHPAYPAAAQRLAKNLLLEVAQNAALRGMLRDAGHNVAAACALYLDATGGITLARLKTLIARFGLVSPGRARALLAHMLHLDLVEAAGSAGERPMRLRVSDHFLASYRCHQASVLNAISCVEPGMAALIGELHRRDVFDRFIIESGDGFARGSERGRAYPALYKVLLHRRAGLHILHDLVARGESFPPSGPIAFSSADAATRFDVSQMHVLRIRQDGVGAGLFTAASGTLTFTNLGNEALDWFYATRLCLSLRGAARTLHRFPASAAS